MEIFVKNLRTLVPEPSRIHFNLQQFVRENITRSWILTLWLIILVAIVGNFTLGQLAVGPVTTSVVLVVWLVTLLMMVSAELKKEHTAFTLWLKENLYSSISNVLITLFLVLLIIAGARAFYNYAWVNANFETDPITSNERQALLTFEEVLAQDGVDVSRLPVGLPFEREVEFNSAGTLLRTKTYVRPEDNPEMVEVTITDVWSGATWGSVITNFENMMLFRFKDEALVWRVWASLALIAILAIPSFFIYRGERFRNTLPRRLLTYAWVASPIIIFILLKGLTADGPANWLRILGALALAVGMWLYNRSEARLPLGADLLRIVTPLVYLAGTIGVLLLLRGSGIIPDALALQTEIIDGREENVALLQPIDPDRIWGGFLLTIIIAVFAIVVSFPLGLILALGRRSQIQGIPWWITYPAAFAVTAWGLAYSTPDNLGAARNLFEQALAFWPLLVPVLAYFFQTNFKGNVVATFSTLYIEVVRGVPLITVLFMAIILFPIFIPADWQPGDTVRVLFAFAFFSAAYLAENVRGGLQSIPKGQYEAADSLGLSTFDKYRIIILPQALRAVIPAIVGQFISLFKDTSLVFLVGLFDILNYANTISSQPDWLGIRTEPYIYLMVLYFLGSSIMAAYSRRLERQLGVGER